MTNDFVERCKVRLVAKGYTQQSSANNLDTFSHVAKLTIIRTLFVVVVAKDLLLLQLNINNAFLYGNLYEKVYMTSPSFLD